MIAFLLFVVLGRMHIKRQPDLGITKEQIDDMLFYGMLGVVLGGRLGYILFYKFSYLPFAPDRDSLYLAGRHVVSRRLSACWWQCFSSRESKAVRFGRSPISSRRWCPRAWAQGAWATSSMANCRGA